MDNSRYNFYKENYPDWSDEQIWTAISLDLKTNDIVKKHDGNINIQDPDILKKIIEGAREWLEAVLPDIFEKVRDLFSSILEQVIEWVEEKVNDILSKLPEYISNFF